MIKIEQRDDCDYDDNDSDDATYKSTSKRRIYSIMNITEELVGFANMAPNGILVRESYAKLYENYIKRKDYILVTGNPGIGKSIFLFYVLKQLLIETSIRKQVFILGSGISQLYYYFNEEVVNCFYSKAELLGAIIEDKDKDIYFLFDCATHTQSGWTPDHNIALFCKKSVVFASPQKKNFKDYFKHCILTGRGTQVYMPVWSPSEVKDMCAYCSYNVSNIMDIYDLVGGIPRMLFRENDIATIKFAVDAAVNGCDDKAKLISFAADYACNVPKDTSHILLRVCPMEEDDDYVRMFVDFGSKYIQERLLRNMIREKKIEFLAMMEEIKYRSAFSVFRGRCFESYAHFRLQEGGDFHVRSLTSSENRILTVKPKRNDTFDKEIALEKNVYYTPKSACFPSVDSLLSPDSAFQMTIAQNHPVQVGGLRMAANLLGNPSNINLYFVVPKDIYDKCTKQMYTNKDGKESKCPPKKFSQWALCLPLIK